MDAYQVLSGVIVERRSIRKYREEEVPQHVLKEILECALWAPSGTNRQNWFIYAVRGEKRDRLVEIISRSVEPLKPRLVELFPEKVVNLTVQFFKNLGGAPVVLLVYIPKYDVELRPEMSTLEKHHREHDRFTCLLSAAALIQNILLLAKARGLGTCWMTAPKYVEDEINRFMGVNDMELVSVIPVGYPDQSPPAPPRKGEKISWVGF